MKKILLLIAILFSTNAFAVEFKGKFLQGHFIIGITESVGGLLLGESLGQIGISLIFILILIFRPTGIFGSKA